MLRFRAPANVTPANNDSIRENERPFFSTKRKDNFFPGKGNFLSLREILSTYILTLAYIRMLEIIE